MDPSLLPFLDYWLKCEHASQKQQLGLLFNDLAITL
jgi:hypothetical protein